MSTATQKFIEDAVKGGWRPYYARKGTIWEGIYQQRRYLEKYHLEASLLNPLAWQAVGKVRGWTRVCSDCGFREPKLTDCQCGDQSQTIVDETNRNWHRFIDHLADGKTIEEALTSIE